MTVILSRPVRVSSRVESWAATPMLRRTAAPARTTSWPATVARPAIEDREGGQNAEDRRLSYAIRPQDAEDRAGFDPETEPSQGRGPSEASALSSDIERAPAGGAPDTKLGGGPPAGLSRPAGSVKVTGLDDLIAPKTPVSFERSRGARFTPLIAQRRLVSPRSSAGSGD
jgi:hypothetical protein